MSLRNDNYRTRQTYAFRLDRTLLSHAADTALTHAQRP